MPFMTPWIIHARHNRERDEGNASGGHTEPLEHGDIIIKLVQLFIILAALYSIGSALFLKIVSQM